MQATDAALLAADEPAPVRRVRPVAWDIGIACVTERLSEALDTTAVLRPYSRLVIDCNRDPTAANSIPEVSEATAIPGNRALSAAERKPRREVIFDLYHGAIAALVDRRRWRRRRTCWWRCTASLRC